MPSHSWPEPEHKEYSADRLNFDDPEAPDYISPSPAFTAYYAKQRAERIIREHNLRLETSNKLNATAFETEQTLDEAIERNKKMTKRTQRRILLQSKIGKCCTAIVIIELAIVALAIIAAHVYS